MKYLLAILISLPAFLSAQSIERQVISGQGASYDNGSIKVDQTIGETIISTESSSGIIITQGFHQPESDLSIDVPEVDRVVKMKIYPNPTSSQVFIDITKVEAESINIQLIDLSAKLLYFKDGLAPVATMETIDMSPFAIGTYILLVRDEKGQTIENFKIELLR